jgi:hypothetical protein
MFVFSARKGVITVSRGKKGGGHHSTTTGKFVTTKYGTSKEGKKNTTYVTNKK